ncbi:MAG: hypothetical protein CME31_18865, partial [Gimesia sp.]|nr:hypothetical protein [Gimesia sp.]
MLSLLVILLIPSVLPADDINGRVPFRSRSFDGELNSRMIEQTVIDAGQFEEHSQPLQRSNYPEQNLNRVIMILAYAGPDLGRNGKSDLEIAREEFKERVEAAMKSIDELFEKEKAIAIKRGNTHGAYLIERQRKRFKEKRILPSVIRTTHFEKEIVVAVTSMQKAYHSEILEFTRNGDKSKASWLETKAYNEISPYLFDGRRVYVRDGGAVYSIQPDHSWLEVKNKGKSHVR